MGWVGGVGGWVGGWVGWVSRLAWASMHGQARTQEQPSQAHSRQFIPRPLSVKNSFLVMGCQSKPTVLRTPRATSLMSVPSRDMR